MTTPPSLTDRKALLLHRTRAARAGAETFLLEDIWSELQERLAEVNRSFTAPAVVTGTPEFWREKLPNAKVVEDTEALALSEDAHDLVLHLMSLHWADDPVGQLVQCRRALKEDGLLMVALFGGETLHELRTSFAEAESRIRGGLSPRVAPMGELRDLGALLQRAGLALPVADVSRKTVEYETPIRLMQDLRAMGETNALAHRDRQPMTKTTLMTAAELYFQHFQGDSGRVRATFDVVFLTGWAPSASQQQPLRPGSASHSLAEALGTTEFDSNLDPRVPTASTEADLSKS